LLWKYETSSGTNPCLDLHFTFGSDLKQETGALTDDKKASADVKSEYWLKDHTS
jgi:hypothetical protein